jgi:hypothetical protein
MKENRTHIPWENWEDKVLVNNLDKPYKELLEYLPNRTISQIKGRRKRLGLSKRIVKKWEDWEDKVLVRNLDKPYKELLELLPNRTKTQIRGRKDRLKLTTKRMKRWENWEDDIIHKNWKKGDIHLHSLLPHRTILSIRHRRKSFHHKFRKGGKSHKDIYLRNREVIISRIKKGELVINISKDYNIPPFSISYYLKLDTSKSISQLQNREELFEERLKKYWKRILSELDNGVSKSSIYRKYSISRGELEKLLQDKGFQKKYTKSKIQQNRYNFVKNEYETRIIEDRNEGFSVRHLERKYPIGRSVIKKILMENNLSSLPTDNMEMYRTNSVLRYEESKEGIIEEYKKGISINILSRKHQIGGSLGYYLQKDGIHEPEERFIHKFNDDFFSKIDNPTKSYWLGWMYSDGFVQLHSITKGKYIGLDLDEKDRLVVEQFRDDLQSNMTVREVIHKPPKNYKWKKKEYRSSRLIFVSENMFNDLGELGVVPQKSLILTYPNKNQVSPDFTKQFLLGYTEGDGSIICSKSGERVRLTYNVVGTKEFLVGFRNEITKILNKYPYEPNISIVKEKRSKGNTYTLHLTDLTSIMIICDEVLHSHNSSMTRKREEFYRYCKYFYETKIENNTPMSFRNISIPELVVEIVLKNKPHWERM